MPKRRKTLEELRLSGATRRNPGRYASRADGPQYGGPLGDPPSRLNDAQKSAWREIAALAPDGVLWRSDRFIVEVACRLMANVRTHGIGGEKGAKAGEVSLLMKCLSSMGLSPADRGKVDLAKQPDASVNTFADLDEEQGAVN